MVKIQVPEKILIMLSKKADLECFYKDRANAVEYEGKKYVYTGSYGVVINCFEAIPEELYNGDTKPLRCYDHDAEVEKGTRQRGYEGRLIDINKIPHVLTNPVEFVPEEINRLILFDIPPIQPEEKIKFQKINTPEQIKKAKRKFNASYRLRKKVGSDAFPKSSKVIFADIYDNEVENIKEVKILIKENGFIVQPLAFGNLK